MKTNTASDLSLLFQALRFAAHKHRDQRRKGIDAVPYINHPIEVAELLLQVGKIDDPQILAAAILHDTLEDTETSPTELEQAFGVQIRAYVEEVSDDCSLPKATRKALQIEHATQLSAGAKAIKLADKIANVQDITATPPANWPLQRRLEYVDWAAQVVTAVGPINPDLEQHFYATLADAKAKLERIPIHE
jgi:guanosine-3',5'-bis(diphosphate) 3'-pyrophosphohydrolase